MQSKTFTTLLALFLPICVTAQAQVPVLLSASGDYRIAYSAPAQSSRIGNAVLLRYYSFNTAKNFGTSAQVLVACDGSWISTTFRDVFHFGEPLTLAQQEAEARSKESPMVPFAIEQTSIGASEVALAEQFARKAPVLCKSANREPKNSFVSISRSGEEKDTFQTTMLVTGTSAKVDGAIDVWLRRTEYQQIPMKGVDGKPWELDGKVQKSPEATGKYMLIRSAFDCKLRQIGTYEQSVYEAGKVTPDSDAIPRAKMRMSSAVPGTVGESQLDWICALYS